MRVKKYSRVIEVAKIKNKIDTELLNSRLHSLFISCKMQMSVYKSMFSQSMDQDGYKALTREYGESKLKFRKLSRSKAINI